MFNTKKNKRSFFMNIAVILQSVSAFSLTNLIFDASSRGQVARENPEENVQAQITEKIVHIFAKSVTYGALCYLLMDRDSPSYTALAITAPVGFLFYELLTDTGPQRRAPNP